MRVRRRDRAAPRRRTTRPAARRSACSSGTRRRGRERHTKVEHGRLHPARILEPLIAATWRTADRIVLRTRLDACDAWSCNACSSDGVSVRSCPIAAEKRRSRLRSRSRATRLPAAARTIRCPWRQAIAGRRGELLLANQGIAERRQALGRCGQVSGSIVTRRAAAGPAGGRRACPSCTSTCSAEFRGTPRCR